tara:strand:+ start:521 stop:736 length:216 start_codon:yes stop_codon:yes gene_type:complete
MIARLKAAADRADNLLMEGVELVWTLSPLGFKLEGRYGAETVTKYVDFSELNNNTDPLKEAEQRALAGLSS